MASANHLFTKDEWSIFAAQKRSQLEDDISLLDEDRLLNTSVHDLCNYFAEKHKVVVPNLLRDQIVVAQREAQIDVANDRTRYVRDRSRPLLVTGTLVEVTVPFTGDAECFDVQPSTFTFYRPRGDVQENTLILHIEGVDLNPDSVRAQIQQSLNEINQNLGYLQSDVDRFNGQLYSYSHTLLGRRRRKLLTDRNLVSALGYKLKERDEDARPFEIPESRRRIAPVLPSASSVPFQPEPTLGIKDYEHILAVLLHAAELICLSPSALVVMDESDLRQHFLIQLNGHFQGKTNAETFTFEGQTDIAIRAEGKLIFIVECRFWTGPTMIVETLNQLLGYASWRDTKVVILLFYRGEDFALTLELLRETVKSHPNFKHELPQLSETAYPYLFAHLHDRNREMLLSVLIFDTPEA